MSAVLAKLQAAANHLRTALTYVRTHKAQVTMVATMLVGLSARFVPELPADDLLRGLATVLAAI